MGRIAASASHSPTRRRTYRNSIATLAKKSSTATSWKGRGESMPNAPTRAL